MSADNGIYVLQTYGPEYRVAYTQAIDNIYGKFNDETLHWEGDKESMRQVFKESIVYGNLEDALDSAEEMSYDYEYLEDGVCVITDFKELKFNED
jgi:hypothetical protein